MSGIESKLVKDKLSHLIKACSSAISEVKIATIDCDVEGNPTVVIHVQDEEKYLDEIIEIKIKSERKI